MVVGQQEAGRVEGVDAVRRPHVRVRHARPVLRRRAAETAPRHVVEDLDRRAGRRVVDDVEGGRVRVVLDAQRVEVGAGAPAEAFERERLREGGRVAVEPLEDGARLRGVDEGALVGRNGV